MSGVGGPAWRDWWDGLRQAERDDYERLLAEEAEAVRDDDRRGEGDLHDLQRTRLR